MQTVPGRLLLWALALALTLTVCQLFHGWSLSALLPPLVAIVLAFATRRPLLSLFCGACVGASLAEAGRPLASLGKLGTLVSSAILDVGHLEILGFTLLLGVVARGASRHLGQVLPRLAESRWFRVGDSRRTQVGTWALGLLLFIDDYLNSMLVGAAARPLFDRAGISRAKLAFLVDATAAPVSSLAPVSTWIAVELGYIADHSMRAGSQGAMAVFLESIPYRFYPLLMLIFALATAISGREFGPMRRARVGLEETQHRDNGQRPRHPWLSSLLPLAVVSGTVLLVMLRTTLRARSEQHLSWGAALSEADSLEALLIGASAGALCAVALEWRESSASGARSLVREGVVGMLPASGILLGAWTLAASLQEIQTAATVAQLLTGVHSAAWLPAGVFVIAALTSFATGTSWGTMAILFPLALPLTSQLSNAPQLEVPVVGAVLAGAVFGDHCSPISDTTVISAAAAGAPVMEHVLTQLPYALLVGAVALTLHLVEGYTQVSPIWLLGLGTLALLALLRLLGGPPSVSP